MNLAEQYKQLHQQGHFKGYQTAIHAEAIAELVQRYRPETLLDYGCGSGEQYEKGVHNVWGGLMPTLYDPYSLKHSFKPLAQFDGVICTDVAEHLPEEDVDAFLADVAQYGRKFIYMTISTKEAKKLLPDGRNAHLTIQPESWWRAKLDRPMYRAGCKLIVEFV